MTRAWIVILGILLCSMGESLPSPYLHLWENMQSYRKIAQRGGWRSIGRGPDLKLGSKGRRVALLRARLAATGDLPKVPPSRRAYFDKELEQAVRRVQRNLGIPVSGIADAETVNALDVPVQVRLGTIRTNLDRWRTMPAELGSRYVLVDIANFQVHVMEQAKDRDRELLAVRAIVGERGMETPVFHSSIRQVVLNPAWEIPREIAVNEALPELQHDPKHATRGGVEIYQIGAKGKRRKIDPTKVDWKSLDADNFPYVLRQVPGPHNPLGTMKFLFPNPYAVFLHGTTEKGMFEASARTMSHGCVRVEKPLELALALLGKDPRGWTRSKIEAELKSGRTVGIALPKPVPVYSIYLTAWSGPEGVQFRPDVYGWDDWDGQTVADLIRSNGVNASFLAE
jgi:murein L,D-transpeptidase YcbB/YkuD